MEKPWFLGVLSRDWATRLCALAVGLLPGACAPYFESAPPVRPPFPNLDFEAATPDGMPFNWYIEAEEAGRDVDVAIDSGHIVSGRNALKVTSRTGSLIPVYTSLFLTDCSRAAALEGAAFAEGPGMTVRPVFFSPGGRVIGAPVALTGNGWQPLRHQLVAASGECLPEGLKIGLLLQGRGEAWIDGLSLLVDGRPWGMTAPPGEPGAAEIRALTAAAIGLENYSAPAPPGRAAALFGSARVVALGENSHGSGALFRMKFDLIRFLVRERGFRILALEAPAATAERINDYVLGRGADRSAAIAALAYPSWKTEEMWRVLEWLREHNRSAEQPVHFRGFDVQDPGLALSAMETAVSAAQEPVMAAALATLRRALEGDRDGKTAIGSVDPLSRQIAGSKTLSAPARQGLLRLLRTFGRGLRLDKPELGGKTRDASMADEVMDLLDEAPSGAKVILWADNTHVTRAGRAMGSFLAERLGDGYLSVGLTFNRGRYSAYGPERLYPVQEGFPGTHEYLLSRRGQGDYLVALSALPAGHALRQIAGFRYIGSRPQRLNQFQPLLLEEHFDIIGFAENTDGTRDLAASE